MKVGRKKGKDLGFTPGRTREHQGNALNLFKWRKDIARLIELETDGDHTWIPVAAAKAMAPLLSAILKALDGDHGDLDRETELVKALGNWRKLETDRWKELEFLTNQRGFEPTKNADGSWGWKVEMTLAELHEEWPQSPAKSYISKRLAEMRCDYKGKKPARSH